MASAQAMGQAFASANMTIWGDPEAVRKMNDAFLRGQQFGSLLDGVSANLPDSVRGLLESVMGRVAEKPAPPTEPTEPEAS